MRLLRRTVLVVSWLAVAVILARIGSGGAQELGNITYAVGELPRFVAIWGIATLAAAIAMLVALARGRRCGLPSFVAGGLAVPLGIYLGRLDHGSGIPLSLVAAVIALTSAVEAFAEQRAG